MSAITPFVSLKRAKRNITGVAARVEHAFSQNMKITHIHNLISFDGLKSII